MKFLVRRKKYVILHLLRHSENTFAVAKPAFSLLHAVAEAPGTEGKRKQTVYKE